VKNKYKINILAVSTISYALLLLCGILTSISGYIVYRDTVFLLEDRLKQRLISIVTTGALQFDPQDIISVKDESDVGSDSFVRATNILIDIRNYNEDIQFAYILRPTADKNIFEFVVDSHSMNPYIEIDLNNDGVIDESDALNIPGDEYYAEDYPVLVEEAIRHPSVDEELIPDQWGLIIAAYSPIKYKGETVGILGVDVDVTDYVKRIRATTIPFILLISFLLLLLSILTIILVRMWGSRVNLLRELDRQKDELLSIVSHQLATPISAVKWNLEMMLDGDMGKLTREQEEHIKTIQPQTENLADLASMILDVSRIQLGRMKVDRTELDVAGFVEEVFKAVSPIAEESGVELKKSVGKNIPKMMLDKRLTRMTLENLLTNAVKYNKKGGKAELIVDLRGNKLHYEVKDTGRGIPKAEHEKIFGKLYRASNVRETEGNGFGLYVAKGAVEAQGGTIGFTSTEGKGTTFYVDLPVIRNKGEDGRKSKK
jgi:signal transduction histidine kinase